MGNKVENSISNLYNTILTKTNESLNILPFKNLIFNNDNKENNEKEINENEENLNEEEINKKLIDNSISNSVSIENFEKSNIELKEINIKKINPSEIIAIYDNLKKTNTIYLILRDLGFNNYIVNLISSHNKKFDNIEISNKNNDLMFGDLYEHKYLLIGNLMILNKNDINKFEVVSKLNNSKFNEILVKTKNLFDKF
jgi:hypothetical protein